MQKAEDCILKKGHDVSSLFSAGGDGGPKTFMPFVAHVAACALRHDAVHNQRANVLVTVHGI